MLLQNKSAVIYGTPQGAFALSDVVIHPATPSRWAHVERLFGERGACGGCWCMVWRLRRAEFVAGKGGPNRRRLRELVEGGRKPGVIAYLGRDPIGWCAVAPRSDYVALARSKVLAPLDDAPVWSISCLFVLKPFRRRGLSAALIDAAADLAARRGATVVEAYPVGTGANKVPDVFAWTGLPSAFLRAGFVEVARRSPTRPIMRKDVRESV
ncbi:MAG TPA: GNAT family N-acetyltransferase [Vicinamibacterales bacterium]|nr:GNAT family N-acetyltransferase [Vicinamibacterales bacterium]